MDPDDLLRVIRRLANGSSPAGAGWTGELIKALVDDHDCFHGIMCLVADILNGVFEGQTRDLLLTGILVAARKSSGAPRPIVMGEAFYKLAGLYALHQVRSDLASVVAPIQMAFTRGASEGALQLLQAALDAADNQVVVSVDIENAYNTRKRSQILEELFSYNELRGLWRLAHWSYGSPTPLLLMEDGRHLNDVGGSVKVM